MNERAPPLPVVCTECGTEYELTTGSTNECPDCGFVAWKVVS